MALPNRGLTSGLRHPSIGGSFSSSGQSPTLIARINEKRVELESLRQLRDLSADLAAQMQVLEDKLSTLSNGTEGVFFSSGIGCLLTIWLCGSCCDGSVELAQCLACYQYGIQSVLHNLDVHVVVLYLTYVVKLPKPSGVDPGGNAADTDSGKDTSQVPLPQTLVRIPAESRETGDAAGP